MYIFHICKNIATKMQHQTSDGKEDSVIVTIEGKESFLFRLMRQYLGGNKY